MHNRWRKMAFNQSQLPRNSPLYGAREASRHTAAGTRESVNPVTESRGLDTGDVLIKTVIEFRHHKGIEVFRILRNVGKLDRATPEEQERVKFHIIRKMRLTLGIFAGMDNGNLFIDAPSQGKTVAEVPNQVHLVCQITQFLVYVEGLREEIDCVVVVPLELEVIAGVVLEVFEISRVPDHANLIHEYDCLRGNGVNAELGRVKEIYTGNRDRRVTGTAFFRVLHGQLCNHSSLARTFFAKDHDKLVRVTEMPPVIRKEKENGKQHKRQYIPEQHIKTS